MARRYYKTFEVNKGARTAPQFDKVPFIVLRSEHSYAAIATWGVVTRLLRSVYSAVLENGSLLGDDVVLQINDGRLPISCNPRRVLSYRIEDYGKTPLYVTYKPRDYGIRLSKVTLWNADIIAKSLKLPDEPPVKEGEVITI